MAKELSDLQVKLTADTSDLEAGLERCRRALREVRNELQALIDQFRVIANGP